MKKHEISEPYQCREISAGLCDILPETDDLDNRKE
jgi:hypothetical protein